MKKFLLALALILFPLAAQAQCNGAFGANQVCGSVAGGIPGPVNSTSFPAAPTTPGGTSGQIQYNNAGAFGGFTASGDCTIVPSSTLIICTKTNGSAFVASATTDTTNASNISSGNLVLARLPSIGANTALVNGTSGSAVPTAFSMPSCSGASSVLQWLTNTGFQCGTINGGVTSLNGATGAVVLLTEPQGRLTLQSHNPVMTSSQSAQGTLYYDCKIGNQVPYYNGANDAIDTIASCEVSNAMQTSGTGVLNASGVFDVWWFHNGGSPLICVATNGSGGGWASDSGGSNTSRGTGYTQLNNSSHSYLTNNNSLTHCYNGSTDYGSIAAGQATYLGTIATDSSAGKVSWTLGAAASGGTAAALNVWNEYNRVDVGTTVVDNGSTYTYSTNSPRQCRASVGMQITFVSGNAEDGVLGTIAAAVTAAGSGDVTVHNLALDATNTVSQTQSLRFSGVSGDLLRTLSKSEIWAPQNGKHTIACTENGDGSNANTIDAQSLNEIGFRFRM